jgi:hypothetical protein
VSYAQPLLNSTDGSEEQLNTAFALSQLCFNLALFPDESREEVIRDMRSSLKLDLPFRVANVQLNRNYIVSYLSHPSSLCRDLYLAFPSHSPTRYNQGRPPTPWSHPHARHPGSHYSPNHHP